MRPCRYECDATAPFDPVTERSGTACATDANERTDIDPTAAAASPNLRIERPLPARGLRSEPFAAPTPHPQLEELHVQISKRSRARHGRHGFLFRPIRVAAVEAQVIGPVPTNTPETACIWVTVLPPSFATKRYPPPATIACGFLNWKG